MALLCMCKVFPALKGKQMIVMSLGGHYHGAYIEGGKLYKESVHEPWGLWSGFWAAVHLVAIGYEPQTLFCSYFSASQGVEL